MSLITDKVFYAALKSNAELVGLVGDRIESTAIPVPDDEFLNEPVPFIIITFDGLQNDGFTKDNSYEGCEDTVQIGIEIDAENREQLGVIAEMVRATVISFFENYTPPTDPGAEDLTQLIPDNYTFSAGPIQYDPIKPCFFQTLTYNCDTTP